MQGSKAKYSSKQKRKAHHIEESEKERGMSSKRAAQIGYATVNKQDGGGKKSGSGRGKKKSSSSSSRTRKSSRGGKRAGSRAAHGRGGRSSHK
jgi:hypothetical protein